MKAELSDTTKLLFSKNWGADEGGKKEGGPRAVMKC